MQTHKRQVQCFQLLTTFDIFWLSIEKHIARIFDGAWKLPGSFFEQKKCTEQKRAVTDEESWYFWYHLIPMIQLRSRCSSSHLCELTRAMFSLCYHLDRVLCSMTHASTSFTEFKVSLQVKVPMCVGCLFEWFCFCFILFLHWYNTLVHTCTCTTCNCSEDKQHRRFESSKLTQQIH